MPNKNADSVVAHDLDRFLEAQEGVVPQALAELRADGG
jgi:uncharacterized protein (DUF1810 family)